MRKYLLAALALTAISTPALAGGTAYLVREWFQNGDQMCQYDNGTVLNMGFRTCPTTINT